MENVKEIVALNVRLARQAVDISQEELAERAGIDLSYESRIERGMANPSVEVLAKLAAALAATELVKVNKMMLDVYHNLDT